LENEYFPEIGEILGVQHPKTDPFSSRNWVFSQKAADYRRIRVYTKSLARYRKERERRRKMRLLAEKGLSQTQIAHELGVSTRTVKRDWDKVRSYVKGQASKEINEISEKRRREFVQRYEGVPPKEQLKLLKYDVKEISRRARMFKPREAPRCGEMAVTLRLDDLAPEGFPCVEVFPNRPNLSLAREFDLKINACKSGEKRELCTLHFTLT
jgi:DNA-binding transcriptional regulator YiaG